MMMQCIHAGGIPALADHVRAADVDNPKGYYEFEPVKTTREDPSWLEGSEGKVVKMVYRLLYDLPTDRSYRVVFMRRALDEVLASQRKMLDRLGQDAGPDDAAMRDLFLAELERFDEWVAGQECFAVLNVDYGEMVADPAAQAARVNDFLGGDLDVEAMADVVSPALHRNRRSAS